MSEIFAKRMTANEANDSFPIERESADDFQRNMGAMKFSLFKFLLFCCYFCYFCYCYFRLAFVIASNNMMKF